VLLWCAACAAVPTRADVPENWRHSVLLVGDSLMGQTAPWVDQPLATAGWDVDIIDAHQNGSGVLGPVGGLPDSLSYVREQLARHPKVDTVVIEWAGACALCGTVDPPYGSEEFFTAWRAQAHRIIDDLRARRAPDGTHLKVAWVKSPPALLTPTDPEIDPARAAVAQVLTLVDEVDLGPAAGPVTPDWYAALADTEMQYRQDLVYDGSDHRVRTDDQVHLTDDGGRRTGQETAAALSRLWS
jgi:hypothetical protein